MQAHPSDVVGNSKGLARARTPKLGHFFWSQHNYGFRVQGLGFNDKEDYA